VDVVYQYQSASALREGQLTLATSGGVTEAGPAPHPCFFRGFLTDPAPAAQALLAVAAVARANYYAPRRPDRVAASSTDGAMRALLDPVVTSNTDRLRFESFSGCCGVHARADLLPQALDGEPASSGTTNVDFNQDMRAALAGVAAAGSPLLLRVGADDVTVTTQTMHVTERKVALPPRWLRGFGEVQALAARMRPVAEVNRAEAIRFLAALPRTARRPLWAVQAGRGLVLTAAPQPGAACVAGPQRLAELRPLARFARGLRVYAPEAAPGALPSPSAWELNLGTARLTFTLSPDVSRGFSGEGALLQELAAGASRTDEDLLGVLLSWEPVLDTTALQRNSGLSQERVRLTLSRLAASGRLGYDLHEPGFFHRELPFALDESAHPRLTGARALLASGAVTLTGDGAVVGEDTTAHRVTLGTPEDTCTCPWWGRHRGTRGPCKHVLAARLAAAQAPGAAEAARTDPAPPATAGSAPAGFAPAEEAR
jgi:hypothetical protein